MGDENNYPFSNSNDAAVEVWERISDVISHLTGHVLTYPCFSLS